MIARIAVNSNLAPPKRMNGRVPLLQKPMELKISTIEWKPIKDYIILLCLCTNAKGQLDTQVPGARTDDHEKRVCLGKGVHGAFRSRPVMPDPIPLYLANANLKGTQTQLIADVLKTYPSSCQLRGTSDKKSQKRHLKAKFFPERPTSIIRIEQMRRCPKQTCEHVKTSCHRGRKTPLPICSRSNTDSSSLVKKDLAWVVQRKA